eukprot:2911814-Rhodomonas_salina.1
MKEGANLRREQPQGGHHSAQPLPRLWQSAPACLVSACEEEEQERGGARRRRRSWWRWKRKEEEAR